jgi:hypothetical protein
VTETTLQTVVTDLTIIQSSLPNSIPAPALEISKTFRAAVILSIPYLLFSFFVSFRVVIAIAGTILLTWRAPWAVVIRATVWRSAWFRWTMYKTWAFLTGQPLAPLVMSPQPTVPVSEAVQSIRFLFTIHENQRWWMGLDWTAALLPAERPSWCSAAQQPMSPPNSFTLPESTTVYLPDGKGRRLKRTATWRWEEPEWRVLVHKERNTISRVERPLPTIKDDHQNNSLLLKAAGRLRNGSQSDSNKTAAPDDRAADDVSSNDDDELTDPDGWVYADNKWENQTNKGGMGKVSVGCHRCSSYHFVKTFSQYTRYRKWTRIAIVFEIVEPTTPTDIGVERNELAPPPVLATSEATSHQPEPILINENVPENPLTQRLKNALKSPS